MVCPVFYADSGETFVSIDLIFPLRSFRAGAAFAVDAQIDAAIAKVKALARSIVKRHNVGWSEGLGICAKEHLACRFARCGVDPKLDRRECT